MALSASLRQLCDGVLRELDLTTQQALRTSVQADFRTWRLRAVVSEPIGLRQGKTLDGESFLNDADLILPFISARKLTATPTPNSDYSHDHIAAALLLCFNTMPNCDEQQFADRFAKALSTASYAMGKWDLGVNLQPVIAPMRRDHKIAKAGREKGQRARKSATALKEFIAEKLLADPSFDLESLIVLLENRTASDPFVYKQATSLWYADNKIHCDTVGKKTKVLARSTVANYFTELRKKAR